MCQKNKGKAKAELCETAKNNPCKVHSHMDLNFSFLRVLVEKEMLECANLNVKVKKLNIFIFNRIKCNTYILHAI